MTSRILEYTSHRHPEITRIQYEGCFRIMGAFVVSAESAKLARESIWHLIDEALIQNTRFFSQKPTCLFILQFNEDLEVKAHEILPVSDDELWIRRRLFVPRRLRDAARKFAERRIPLQVTQREDQL
jgi:hypothetical protein